MVKHIILWTLKDEFTGLCFANLNDFDSLYGHRRNPEGYANALTEFDNYLEEILNKFEDIESINDMSDSENGIKIHIGKDSELSEDVSVIKTKHQI